MYLSALDASAFPKCFRNDVLEQVSSFMITPPCPRLDGPFLYIEFVPPPLMGKNATAMDRTIDFDAIFSWFTMDHFSMSHRDSCMIKETSG